MGRCTVFAWLVVGVACSGAGAPGAPAGACLPDGVCPTGTVCDLPSNRCVPPVDAECTEAPCREPVAEHGVDPVRALDVLVLVDNSIAVIGQSDFLGAFPAFVDAAARPGALPDLHLGVISPDLGAGDYEHSPGCETGGDQGLLQSQPRGLGCEGPSDAFIVDVDGDGARQTNYQGSLAEVFRCIGQLGVGGCGFEQPFEAMRLALDGRNPGFRRPGAALLLIMYLDEDDCSAIDPAIYSPEESEPVGPLGSFRCFEHGVTCEGDDDPRQPGPRAACQSREDSAYLASVEATFHALAAAGERVALAVISGPAAPVEVVDLGGRVGLHEACIRDSEDGGVAGIGVRLVQLAQRFGVRGQWHSICGDFTPAWQSIAGLALRTLGTECVTLAIADVDPAAAGVQPDCVAETLADGDRRPLSACDAEPPEVSSRLPCYRVEEEPACAGFEQSLRFAVYGAEPAAHHLLRCRR